MKTLLRTLGGPLFIGLLLMVSLSPLASAHSTKAERRLPLSPLSGGVLMARAIHTGAIHAGHGVGQTINPALTCSPAPCVLPNVKACGGTQPVNEDPIAADPGNAQNLLSGGNDYNCSSTLQGF